MTFNLNSFAKKFLGVKEITGEKDNYLVMAWLCWDNAWPQHDEVPWCSAFLNFLCDILELPRTKSLAAKSWLTVGQSIPLTEALPCNDIVILTRNGGGHVGVFESADPNKQIVYLIGGNQSNKVCIEAFPYDKIVGVRRLANPNR